MTNGRSANANHRIRPCALDKASEVFFQMAHMHEIGGKAGAGRGTSTPTGDHTGHKSSPRFGFVPPPLPFEASELLADQRCLTQKSAKKREHRDGTRLIHVAILVSGVFV